MLLAASLFFLIVAGKFAGAPGDFFERILYVPLSRSVFLAPMARVPSRSHGHHVGGPTVTAQCGGGRVDTRTADGDVPAPAVSGPHLRRAEPLIGWWLVALRRRQ